MSRGNYYYVRGWTGGGKTNQTNNIKASDVQYVWKEIIIGVFFIGGIFAGMQITDPYVQVLQILTNMSAGTSVHSVEVTNLNNYVLISTLLTFVAAAIVLVALGVLGGVSIVTSYYSGFLITHHAYVGLALLAISWLCIWYAYELKRKQ